MNLFKSVPFRLGKGENIHARVIDGTSFRLLYNASGENGEKVVKSKIISRKVGFVESVNEEISFEAEEVIDLGDDLFFASLGNKRIKLSFYV